MDDKVDDGGQAFPISEGPSTYAVYGMTLRDWFAGQALTGMLANTGSDGTIGEYVVDAYSYADAMIAERRKMQNQEE